MQVPTHTYQREYQRDVVLETRFANTSSQRKVKQLREANDEQSAWEVSLFPMRSGITENSANLDPLEPARAEFQNHACHLNGGTEKKAWNTITESCVVGVRQTSNAAQF